MAGDKLTHLREDGAAHMVDIGDKSSTKRVARASGEIHMDKPTLAAIQSGNAPKGDVLSTARIAAIMAAKNTAHAIPLCHIIPLSAVTVEFQWLENGIKAIAEVKCHGKTGVEIEALQAVQIALLTIYDMAKALDKSMVMTNIMLEQKSGGQSGDFERQK